MAYVTCIILNGVMLFTTHGVVLNGKVLSPVVPSYMFFRCMYSNYCTFSLSEMILSCSLSDINCYTKGCIGELADLMNACAIRWNSADEFSILS